MMGCIMEFTRLGAAGVSFMGVTMRIITSLSWDYNRYNIITMTI